uniref:Helitron helicase-like domain-containing protein n=1 Tax=Lactuca sativa TaxID=4236 RepID=A0A9R1WN62_LACSA|nr:hypothetical protein LSAT_V11C100019130 [Lactuca sativa]
MAYYPIPTKLHQLFTRQEQLEESFRYNIRAYNSNFSFASLGVKVDKELASMNSGVYTFCAHGTLHHNINQLISRDGKSRYLQLYFYYGERSSWKNVDRRVIKKLTHILASNPYIRTFKRLSDLGPLDNYRVTLNTSVELDQRLYNKLTTSKVLLVFGFKEMTTSLHIKEVLLSMGGLTIVLKFNLTLVVIILCRLLYSLPMVSLDGILKYQDMGSPWMKFIVTMKTMMNNLLQKKAEILLRLHVWFLFEKNKTKIRANLYQGVVDCFNAGEAQASRVGQRVALAASFIGGPRDMRRRFLDAMALVQSAQDQSGLVARVFHANLEDLKVQLFQRHIIGVVGSYVYVIEFQKLLVVAYEKNVHVYMVCQNPRQFNEKTSQGEDSYPLYKRKNNGIEVIVRNTTLDNRWLVPYNPKLLMMLNCHINIEVCSSIKSVKYLFKYVYKGHDKKVIHIDKDQENDFQDTRYVSPPKALRRVFSFPHSKTHPCVMALQIHLPNQQCVSFKDGDRMEDIVDREKEKNSMLMAFFKKNKEDSNARKYLYKDFPKHFTWNR